MWKPEVLDVRGDGYGFVMDKAQTRRVVFSYDYPHHGELNIMCGNWGPLKPSALDAARKFVENEYPKLTEVPESASEFPLNVGR